MRITLRMRSDNKVIVASLGHSVLCPMCNFQTPSVAHLVHRNDPRFCAQCGIGGCSYTGRSFSALYSHIYRTHPDSGIIKRRGAHDSTRPAEVPETSELSELSNT